MNRAAATNLNSAENSRTALGLKIKNCAEGIL